jgi:phenylalanyl-tRNA synthetase alpha chain
MGRTPEQVLSEAREQLAASRTEQDFEAVRIRYLGKNGEITALMKSMGGMAPE